MAKPDVTVFGFPRGIFVKAVRVILVPEGVSTFHRTAA
jgi:hypothetical protein